MVLESYNSFKFDSKIIPNNVTIVNATLEELVAFVSSNQSVTLIPSILNPSTNTILPLQVSPSNS